MNKKKIPCGEIIQSSLSQWTCQSWQWDSFPSFGSLVTVTQSSMQLFAVVSDIQTGSIDPTRQPMAYKKTEQQLKDEHPELFEFLRTTFFCIVLGYSKQDVFFHVIPPRPPKIHSFVTIATEQEQKKCFSSTHYLHLLFAHAKQLINIDELLLAIIHNQVEKKLYNKDTILSFMQTYSFLTGNDYRRIKQFINRIL